MVTILIHFPKALKNNYHFFTLTTRTKQELTPKKMGVSPTQQEAPLKTISFNDLTVNKVELGFDYL
jgi:hypothetical protein